MLEPRNFNLETFAFDAIGTHWQVEIYDELSAEKRDAVFDAVKNRIELFDKAYSRFRDDSLVMEMSRNAGVYTLPDDAQKMLTLYHTLYKQTDGLFTPLVGNLLSDAGYDATYTLQKKSELREVPAWDDVIDYAHPTLTLKKPVILDFGAGGKGYLVDLVGEELALHGITQYCVDAGGDILYNGAEPIRIGLENPEDPTQVIGVYTLACGSICGSAGNRRAWGEFTHVMNPKTLTSQKDILAVWVVADHALLADALATCLFFVPASSLASLYNFEYVIIKSDHSFETSSSFSGELFTR